jgi:protein-tyrosine-phosphatase
MQYKRILFVSGSNQCRGPMVEAILKEAVIKNTALSGAGIEVMSAGISPGTGGGSPCSIAIQVMREHGLDIQFHKARHVNGELLGWADVVLVMENKHKDLILARYTGICKKVYLLTEFAGEKGDVFDPAGYDVEVYRECANMLKGLANNLVVIREVSSKCEQPRTFVPFTTPSKTTKSNLARW